MPVFNERKVKLVELVDYATELDLGTKYALKAKIDEIATINTDLNAQIMKLIANPGQFSDKSAFEGAWNGVVDNAMSRLSGVFNSAPTGTPLPLSFRNYWMTEVYVQEALVLQTARLEGWRSQLFYLCGFETQMKKLIVEMTDKWNKLLSDKSGFITPEKQAIDLITDGLKKAVANSEGILQSLVSATEVAKGGIGAHKGSLISEAASQKAGQTEQQAKEWAQGAITKYFGGVTGFITDKVTKRMRELLTEVGRNSVGYAKQMRTGAEVYKSQILNTGYVLGMFKTNRDLVTKYKSETDSRKIETARSEANAALANRNNFLGGKCKFPKSIMDDMDVFHKKIMVEFEAVASRCVAADKDFSEKFNGVFYGSLQEATIEKLTDTKYFDSYVGDTIYRVDFDTAFTNSQKLKGSAETLLAEIRFMAADPAGVPESVKFVFLSKSEQFLKDMQTEYDASVLRFIEMFASSQGDLKVVRMEIPTLLDRRALPASIS